jgi:DNA polymerase-1
VAEWIKRCIERATMLGFTETWWGRRRYIPELRESNKNLVEAGKRIATNSPVQGTSAELMKIAMIRVDSALVNKGIAAHIVLQIHDELVIEVDEKDEKVVAEIVKREMEGVVDWDVPFKVSLRTGENWGDVTK